MSSKKAVSTSRRTVRAASSSLSPLSSPAASEQSPRPVPASELSARRSVQSAPLEHTASTPVLSRAPSAGTSRLRESLLREIDLAESLNSARSVVSTMSLHSLAKLELELGHEVPISDDGGFAKLTAKDISQIKDSDTLEFLQTHSALFVQHYVQESATPTMVQSASVESAVAEVLGTFTDTPRPDSKHSTASSVRCTFLTATDSLGRKYSIAMPSDPLEFNGTLLVPLDGAGEPANSVRGVDVDDTDFQSLLDSSRTVSDSPHHEEVVHEVSGPDPHPTPPASTAEPKRHQRRIDLSLAHTRGTSRPRYMQLTESRTAAQGSSELPPHRSDASNTFTVTHTRSNARSSIPAPPPAESDAMGNPSTKYDRMFREGKLPQKWRLLDDEQTARVEALLADDAVLPSSGFVVEQQPRLREIEEKLATMRAARETAGVALPSSCANLNLCIESPPPLAPCASTQETAARHQSPTRPRSPKTVKELGTMYLEHFRREKRERQQINLVNERLEALHQQLDILSTPPFVFNRTYELHQDPESWVWPEEVVKPTQDQINALVESARRECSDAATPREPSDPTPLIFLPSGRAKLVLSSGDMAESSS